MCSTTTVDGLDDQVQHVEDLVLLRKHGEAAVAASALLRGFASRPCEAQTLQRCALAALHAHIYGGRHEDLNALFCQELGMHLLDPPTLMAWVLLLLETSQPQTAKQRIEQYMQLVTQPSESPYQPCAQHQANATSSSPSSASLSPSEPTPQSSAAPHSWRPQASSHADRMALCRLYTQDVLTHGLGQPDAALQWLGATRDGQGKEGADEGEGGVGAEHSSRDAAHTCLQRTGPVGAGPGAEGEGKGGVGVCSCVLGPGGVRQLLPGDEDSVGVLWRELEGLVDGMQRAAAAAAAAAGVARTRPSAPAGAAQRHGQAAAGPKTHSKAAAALSAHGFPAVPSDDLRRSMDQAATSSLVHSSGSGKPALAHANGSHPVHHGPGTHASTPAATRGSFSAAPQARGSNVSSSNPVLAALLAWLRAAHAALRALASAATRGLSTAQAWVVCRAAAAWVKVKEAVGRLGTGGGVGGWSGQVERLATAAVLGSLLLAALRAEAPHVRVHVGSQAAWLWEAVKDALRMGTALHPSPVAVP